MRLCAYSAQADTAALLPGTARSKRSADRNLRRCQLAARHRLRCACASTEQRTSKAVQLTAEDATPANFSAFGQVIGPTDDGKQFDGEDAQLQLNNGKPRFYVMRLPRRGLTFDRITFHAKVTQCLGGLQPAPWYLAVAAPSGSAAAWPRPGDLRAFRVPHGAFVKLHAGTWHAGPLFAASPHMDFYNLELSDTNITDHNTKDYTEEGLEFEVVVV